MSHIIIRHDKFGGTAAHSDSMEDVIMSWCYDKEAAEMMAAMDGGENAPLDVCVTCYHKDLEAAIQAALFVFNCKREEIELVDIEAEYQEMLASEAADIAAFYSDKE